MQKVLAYLKKAGLQVDIDKCEFYVTETKFLSFIVGIDGVVVDLKKEKALKNWQVPTIVKGVQFFFSFCNFYRQFIREFGRIA